MSFRLYWRIKNLSWLKIDEYLPLNAIEDIYSEVRE